MFSHTRLHSLDLSSIYQWLPPPLFPGTISPRTTINDQRYSPLDHVPFLQNLHTKKTQEIRRSRLLEMPKFLLQLQLTDLNTSFCNRVLKELGLIESFRWNPQAQIAALPPIYSKLYVQISRWILLLSFSVPNDFVKWVFLFSRHWE